MSKSDLCCSLYPKPLTFLSNGDGTIGSPLPTLGRRSFMSTAQRSLVLLSSRFSRMVFWAELRASPRSPFKISDAQSHTLNHNFTRE